jgi:ABC-type lipoprotein export system ATPase subunit
VLIDGTDIARLSEDELAALRNRVVGFVFQFHYLLDELTCLENVLTPITIGAIIRALANQPKIVLADEPTGNLESRSGDDVFNIMREMNRENGVAFIMVTHDDRLAQEADRILMIEDGWVHQVDKYEHRRKLLSSLKEA